MNLNWRCYKRILLGATFEFLDFDVVEIDSVASFILVLVDKGGFVVGSYIFLVFVYSLVIILYCSSNMLFWAVVAGINSWGSRLSFGLQSLFRSVFVDFKTNFERRS